MNDAQEIIEQRLMPPLLDEGAQRAGGERRQIDRHHLRGHAADDERHQPGVFGRRESLRQQPQRKAREILAALAVAQPVGDEGAEIDLAQFRFDRAGCEKMHLDEFAERVRDAMLVALDDRGMRDRQPERAPEQRDHGVPVGDTADGGGLGEGRDEAEGRMHVEQRLGGHKQRQRCDQHQGREQLDALELRGAGGVDGGVEGKGRGRGHDFERFYGGFRLPVIASEAKHPARRGTEWIASSPSLLAMTETTTPTISKDAQPKKKARAKRALNSTVQCNPDQAVLP